MHACTLMANDDDDDARQALLSEPKDIDPPPNNAIEKSALRRRTTRQSLLADGGAAEISPNGNGVRRLQWLESLFEEQRISFKQVFIVLVAYLGVGTLCFFLIMHQIEGKKTNRVLDAIYFCVVTMTTVGYGDLVPHSALAKLLACVYVFTGMAIVGMILSKAADYIVEKQEMLLVKAMHIGEKIDPPQILKEVETNKLKYKFLSAAAFLLVVVTVGTIFLCVVEDFGFVDAFYCVCSTITTLGYGDQSFSTRAGRIFAVFWILSGTICLAQFFLYLAEMYTEKKQRSLVKWVLSRVLTCSDLEAADLDHDKVVSPSEFIVFTLKEMGKISQEDISLVMERFRKLDVDHSGTLTEADILQSQSS